MKKFTKFSALAVMLLTLMMCAFTAFAGTQILSIRVRPGTKMYFEAKVDFLVTVEEITKHSGSDNVYLDTSGLVFRNQVMAGYVSGRNVGDEAIYLIRSKANDYITLRITIANDAPLMSPGDTTITGAINSGNSDVVLKVGQTDASTVSFFSVSELASSNTAVATTFATPNSDISGSYKINITGVSDGSCIVTFKAATALGGTVMPFQLSVLVGNGGSTVTDTTLDKLMPTSVTVGVGQTWTKQLSYSKIGFLSTSNSSSSYTDSLDVGGASVSYNAYSGILTIIGKSVGYFAVGGQYALGAQATPQEFSLSINVQQNAAATPAPTPTPAPAKQVGLKIGSRKDGATLSYSYAKYNKKIVTLAKSITVDGVAVAATSLNWTSSNPAVITVDANGKIRFAGPGTSVLTVATADGKYTASFNFSVS